MDLVGDCPRGQGHQLLRVVSDELRLRVRRLRTESISTGRSTERAKLAGSIARVVDRHQALFLTRGPRAPRSRSSTTRWRTSSAAVNAPPPTADRREKSSASSATRCSACIARCFQKNVPIDYVHINHLVRGQLRSLQAGHPALPADAARASAGALREYVQTAARSLPKRGSAWNNEKGLRVRPRARPRPVGGDGRREKQRSRPPPERTHVDQLGRAAICPVSPRATRLPAPLVQGNPRAHAHPSPASSAQFADGAARPQ